VSVKLYFFVIFSFFWGAFGYSSDYKDPTQFELLAVRDDVDFDESMRCDDYPPQKKGTRSWLLLEFFRRQYQKKNVFYWLYD